MNKDNGSGTKVTTDEYFGGCPECGKTDGYVNTGSAHWSVCDTHKTIWLIGSNLFSCWKDETEEEQRKVWDQVGDYRRVKPILPQPPSPEELTPEMWDEALEQLGWRRVAQNEFRHVYTQIEDSGQHPELDQEVS